MRQRSKKLLGVLLSLVLVLGLMPGMNLTAYAQGIHNTDLTVGKTIAKDDVIYFDRGVHKHNGVIEFYYTLSDGLLVEKWLVRLDTENAPDLRSVYAKNNEAALYDNPYCEGEPILKLKYDQKLNVLDAMGAVLRVTVEDSTNGGTKTAEGYVLVTGTKNYYDGSYGGGEAPAPRAPTEGYDGGEITLSASRVPVRGGMVLLSAGTGKATRSGKILAQGAEGYACTFKRGDEVQVLEKGEELCVILLDNGTTAEIPTKLLFFPGDEVTEPWTGYAKSGALCYRCWRTRLDVPEKLNFNAQFQVVGSFEDFLIILKADGSTGLIAQNLLSETQNYYYSEDGGSGGGRGGSSGPEWTDPVL